MGEVRKIVRRLPLHYFGVVVPLTLACLLLLLGTTPQFEDWSPSAGRPNSPPASIELFRTPGSMDLPAHFALTARALFPYSIIPGGVESAEELENAAANDSVVAAHYAGFNLPRARVIRPARDRFVHVSYRIGGSVFWTKKTLRIAAGEALITDGSSMARTRCGNRISETPMEPVSPAEPKPEALETAQDFGLLAEPVPVFELPIGPPPGTNIQFAEHHHGFIPPVIPIVWGGSPSTPGIPVNPPPPPPPPANVPEPGTLLLLTAGFSAVSLLRMKRRP